MENAYVANLYKAVGYEDEMYMPVPAKRTRTTGTRAPRASNANRYANITLTPTTRLYATVTTNPRRAPTNPNQAYIGYHMMQALIAAGATGLTWAEYQALGGRTEDIRWDVQRGWARVE